MKNKCSDENINLFLTAIKNAKKLKTNAPIFKTVLSFN